MSQYHHLCVFTPQLTENIGKNNCATAIAMNRLPLYIGPILIKGVCYEY